MRGFNRASPARARLEQVGTSVVHYYNLAVAEGCGDNLAEYLLAAAAEGATLADQWEPYRQCSVAVSAKSVLTQGLGGNRARGEVTPARDRTLYSCFGHSSSWLAKMADADYEGLCTLIEAPVPRRSPASESQRADRELSQSA